MPTTADASCRSTPEALWFLNNHVEVRVSGADNNDGMSVLLHTAPFDEAPPLHVHHGEDEIFHILQGRVRFQVDGNVRVAEAGETVLAPAGLPHGFRVISPEGARILTVTRGGFERMVRSVSRPAEAPVPPPPTQPTPELRAILTARCADQRIELLGPPIA